MTLQPLHRRTDFGDIARHLLRAIDPNMQITDGAVEALSRIQWSGNIRELRSVLSRLTLGDRGGRIDENAVRDAIGGLRDDEDGAAVWPGAEADVNLHDLQRARILSAYAETNNNISKAARRLGVSRNTIYRALQGRHR